MINRKWFAPLALAAALSPANAQTWTKLNTGIARNVSPNRIGIDIGSTSSSYISIGTIVGGALNFDLSASLPGQVFAATNTWSAPNTWAYTDVLNIGAGSFFTPYFFSHSLTTGATGNRNSVVAQIQTGVSVAGDFIVPLMGLAHITGGSGNIFGANGYAWVDATAASSAQASGGEFNTDIRTGITSKTGVQIVDVATSTGAGSSVDAGLWLATQTGGAGYKYGIEFSAAGGAFPVKAAGSLFKTGAGTVTKGIDLSATTFTGNVIDVPNAVLNNAGQLSLTRPSAGRSLVLTGYTGSDQGGEIQMTNATGGSKFMRVAGTGSWQILNSAYGATIVDVTDAGAATFSGALTTTGVTSSGGGSFAGLVTTQAISTSAPTTKTANYTVDSGASKDSSIIFNGAGSLTITLPAAASFSGRILRVKTIAAQTVVSASSNVVPLAGGAAGTAILAATAGKWADLQSDGSNWIIMAAN